MLPPFVTEATPRKSPTEPSERAIGIAARVWCDQDMRDIVMDVGAAERIASIIDEVLKIQGK